MRTGAILAYTGIAMPFEIAAAPAFLVLAWAYLTSMMVASSWGQIDNTPWGEIVRRAGVGNGMR